jgi:Fe-S-cluster containining protein
MKTLVIDLDKINQQAKIKGKENIRFRSFLKGKDDNRVDKIVHAINKEVVEQIDCTKCGNCCNTLRPSVSENEIRILANLEKISQEEYTNTNTEKDTYDNGRYLKDSPCKYLDDKKCSIYASRPHDCKSFPHIDKNCFNSRTLGMIENYAICPIVFNVLEKLKEEFKFR